MAKDTQKTIEGTIGAFKQLKQEVTQLKDELSTLTKEGKTGTDEWTKKAKELADAQKKVDAVTKAAKGNFASYNAEQVKSINDLKERIKLLNQERNAMDMNSKEYAEATKELKVLNDQLREAGTSAGDWKANVGNYANSIKDAFGDLGVAAGGLTGSLGGLNTGLLNIAKNPVGGTVMAIASAIKLLADGIKSSEENTKTWNEAMIPLKTVFVMLQNTVQDVAGKFAEFVKRLGESETTGKVVKGILEGLVTVFNVIKTSIGNVIGAVQDSFSAIKEFVGKLNEWTQGLQKVFKPVWEGVEKVANAVWDMLQPAIEWIINAYNDLADSWLGRRLGMVTIEQLKEIRKNSKETADEITEDFKNTKDTVTEATEATNKLNSSLRGLKMSQANLNREVSKYAAAYQEAIENKDYEAAQEALNKKREKEIELAKVGVAIAAAKRDELAKQAKLTKNSIEINNALADAEAAVIDAQAKQDDVLRSLSKEQTKLNKLKEAEAKAAKDAAFKNSIEELNKALNNLAADYSNAVNALQKPLKPEGGEVNKDTINEYYDQITANAEAEYLAYQTMMDEKIKKLEEFIEVEKAAGNDVRKYEEDLAKYRREQSDGYIAQQKKMNDTITAANKERLKVQKNLQKSEIKIYADLFDSISGMFEEDTIAYKATATAKALINTYLGATAAFTETPGPIYVKGAAMTAAILAGIANVKKIWDVNPTGGNSISTSSPTVAEPVVEQPEPFSYSRTVQTYEEQDELNKPMWVSVTDINNVQNRVKVVEEESSF